MAKKAPGKAHREGLTIVQLMDMFPTEEAATEWFESAVWPDGERHCGKCGSTRTREVPNAKPMPYWCTDCRSYFSVRTGTPIARSNVSLRKWAIAIYLCLTNLKSVSSMKLQRDIAFRSRPRGSCFTVSGKLGRKTMTRISTARLRSTRPISAANAGT